LNKFYFMRSIFSTLMIMVFFIGCQRSEQGQGDVDHRIIRISDSIFASQEIDSIIRPYQNKIESEMNRKLSYSPSSMYKTDHPLNTSIGNLMADAVLEMSDSVLRKREQEAIDAVLLNYGGIRAGINEGDVTVRTAYDIMPFENQVVVAKLGPDAVNSMVDYLVKAGKAHPISGMQVVIDEKGNLVTAKINGEKISNEENYHIATSDYLFNGGDDMNFFEDAKTRYDVDYKLRNLFIDYFKKQDTLPVVQDERFIQREQ